MLLEEHRGGTTHEVRPYVYQYTGMLYAKTLSPTAGDYCGGFSLCYTVEANPMSQNDYNLYNMAGNVSEWNQ